MRTFSIGQEFARKHVFDRLGAYDLFLLQSFMPEYADPSVSLDGHDHMSHTMDVADVSSSINYNFDAISSNYNLAIDGTSQHLEKSAIISFSLESGKVRGGNGDDLFVIKSANTFVDGYGGHDAVILPWAVSEVALEFFNGTVRVSAAEGAVELKRIEAISFQDVSLSMRDVIDVLSDNSKPEASAPSIFESVISHLPEITMDGSSMMHHGMMAGHSGHGVHEAALLKLVAVNASSVIALKSGDWSDPSIWSTGEVPGEGACVVIPRHTQVQVDDVFNDSLFTVRVDGKLSFQTDVNTGLTLDTMVVTSTGHLEMGTEMHSIQPDVTARILIADNGPIDREWDPGQISRGVVSLGEVTVHGTEMTTHTKVAHAPDAGDTSIILSETPLNWSVGDELVITGTQFVPKSYNPATGEYDIYNGTQDEVRTITQVVGNQVWFDEPLSYDHHVPASGLAASVANLTRNVVWETENAEDIPANQRAHSMFMHNNDVDVRYLQVQEFGRTDRSYGMDDYETYIMQNQWNSEGRLVDSDGNWIEGEATNIRGRYALHFHMAGVDSDDEPGLLKGNSVVGSPGWGYVQHNSYANFEDNVAYDVYGASFSAETGNEVGRWENNLAIAGEGRDKYIKWGTYNMDLGGEGYGFWMNGRSLDLIDNIAVGMSEAGFAWFSRGIDMIETKASNLDVPELARGLDTIHDIFLPFGEVSGNEVYSTEAGFIAIRGIHTASQQINDSRSVMTDFKAWEVQQGFHLEYSSSYTFSDGLLISADYNNNSSGLYQVRNAGLNIQRNYEDLVLEDVQIEGFRQGVYHTVNHTITIPRVADGFQYQVENGWGLRFINVDINGANQEYSVGINKSVSIVDPDTIVGYDLALDIDNTTLVARWTSDEARFTDPLAISRGIVLEGTKYDSLGTVEFPDGNERIYYTQEQVDALLVKQGYLTDTDGDCFLYIRELITDRRTGEGELHSMVVAIDPDWQMPDSAFDNQTRLADYASFAELPEMDFW